MLNTIVPYGLLWMAMITTVQHGYPYALTLALAAVAGCILVRIFILFHDCCHRSFFRARWANVLFGYVTGILTFTPFADWRDTHNRHHATAGNLDRRGTGEIWTMTLAEYQLASRWKRMRYRIYRNPFFLFGPGAAVLFLVLQRVAKKGSRRSARISVWVTNIALAAITIWATETVGWLTYAMIQLPVILIGGSLGLWLFYIQHQFENVFWSRSGSWDALSVAMQGSSYVKLPSVLQWLTGNIGLHHIHHIQPGIPNYNLQRCYNEVASLRAVHPITLKMCIRALWLGLYDEEKRKLVGFHSSDAPNSVRCAL
jgi:omega-6 fatty acid desaturase (delta-12 desaturase)